MNAVQQASGSTTRFVVLTIDETGHAAFVDGNRSHEIARLIEDAARRLGQLSLDDDVKFMLHDVNGNRVGQVETQRYAPGSTPKEGAAHLSIELGNAAFESDVGMEVSRILRVAAGKVRAGESTFALSDVNGNVVGSYAYQEVMSLENDGVIDMNQALNEGRVYLAEGGYGGLAEDAFRYVVTTPDFEPGYGQGAGGVWLVNANGEIASGYEDPQTVRENLFRGLKRSEADELRAVAEGRVSFEDFERRFEDGDPDLGYRG